MSNSVSNLGTAIDIFHYSKRKRGLRGIYLLFKENWTLWGTETASIAKGIFDASWQASIKVYM